MGIEIPHEKGQFWGKGLPIVKYRDILPWAVQKRPNRSICRFGCRLRWAEGSTSSIALARWRQCAHMGGHIGATWRRWLNHLSAVAMRSNYVKLLWPLIHYGNTQFRSTITSVLMAVIRVNLVLRLVFFFQLFCNRTFKWHGFFIS